MSTVRTLTPVQRRRSLIAVLASAFGVGLVMGLSMPLISLTLEARGWSTGAIGLNAAAFATGMLLTGPFVPAIAARLGTLPTLWLGVALVATALACFPLTEGAPAAAFALRVVLAIGTTLDWIVSETWINTLPEEKSRGRIIAIYATLWAGGIAAGPAVLILIGTAGAGPFLFAAGLIAVAYLPVLAVRRTAPRLGSRAGPRAALILLGLAPVGLLAGFLSGFGEGAMFSLLPVYGLAGGIDAQAAVLMTTVFALGGIALQAPIGWLADRMDRTRLLFGCVLLAVALALLMPAATDSLLWRWPGLFALGGAIIGFYTIGLILIGQRFAGGDLAVANTAFILMYTAGSVAGPALGGAAMDLTGRHGLTGVLAIACALFLQVAWRLRHRESRPLPAATAAPAAEGAE